MKKVKCLACDGTGNKYHRSQRNKDRSKANKVIGVAKCNSCGGSGKVGDITSAIAKELNNMSESL